MRTATEIVRSLRQTEKSARLASSRQYAMDVAISANKIEIRNAVEQLFKVKVVKVTTQRLQGKLRRLSGRQGRRPERKRAYVTVAEGQSIEIKA